MPQYVVLQVALKEKLVGTTSAHSTGMGGGDRIQATMVFEKL